MSRSSFARARWPAAAALASAGLMLWGAAAAAQTTAEQGIATEIAKPPTAAAPPVVQGIPGIMVEPRPPMVPPMRQPDDQGPGCPLIEKKKLELIV